MAKYDADHIPVFTHGLDCGFIYRDDNGWHTSPLLSKLCGKTIFSHSRESIVAMVKDELSALDGAKTWRLRTSSATA